MEKLCLLLPRDYFTTQHLDKRPRLQHWTVLPSFCHPLISPCSTTQYKRVLPGFHKTFPCLRQNKLTPVYVATVKRPQTLPQNIRDEYGGKAFEMRDVTLNPEDNSFRTIKVTQLSHTVIADNCKKSLVESLTLTTIGLTSSQETRPDVETYL